MCFASTGPGTLTTTTTIGVRLSPSILLLCVFVDYYACGLWRLWACTRRIVKVGAFQYFCCIRFVPVFCDVMFAPVLCCVSEVFRAVDT